MNSPNDAHTAHELKLPSRFTFGDPVIVYFGTAGIVKNCRVIKIYFTESKVFYDVEVKWQSTPESGTWTDRLYNIDSANVYPESELEMLQNSLTSKNS